MFGLGLDTDRTLELIPPTTLHLHPGQVVFVTGPSGSGKSTILRLIREHADAHPDTLRAADLDDQPAPADRPLVDLLPDRPLDQVLRLLSVAGLNDAWVLLRRPAQLSDGQRFRLRLALALDQVGSTRADPDAPLTVLLADEFAATLDRTTAAVIARNLARWVRPRPLAVALATTHDDLLEPLAPDTLLHKPLGESLQVLTRGPAGGQ
jgi:ABC-type ATPase with predicted acetyltransferase domain